MNLVIAAVLSTIITTIASSYSHHGINKSRRDAISKLCNTAVLLQCPLTATANTIQQNTNTNVNTNTNTNTNKNKNTNKQNNNVTANKNLINYEYRDDWKGTSLSIMTPKQAASLPESTFSMAKWPDPILRRPANLAHPSLIGTADLHDIACKLKNTAQQNQAVGLAAQQCGVDVSLVYLDDSTYPSSIYHHLSSKLMSVIRTDKPINPATQRTCIDSNTNSPGAGIFLVNPRIITRSPETDMTVWNERCLVLPPTLTATVLRDSIVQVRYETIDGNTQTITLHGELARAAQHEMDHDRGILILDHVTLEELETDDMRRIEGYGHDARMALAYARST